MKKYVLYILVTIFIASLLVSSCDNKVYTASILIHELIPPPTNTHSIFIAVSREPGLGDVFITDGVIIPPGGPFTEILIPNIIIKNDTNDYIKQFSIWFLVAEDTDNDGKLSLGDNYLPFAELMVTPNSTYEINAIDFSSTLNFDPSLPKRQVSIIHSSPERVDKYHKIHLSVENADIYWTDAELCKNIVFWWDIDNNSENQASWDTDGNGNYNDINTDYTTNPIFFAPERTIFFLSPLQKF